jgi:DNA polymerase-4
VIVAHLDLDAFYAAVEELENPELRAQPLVVGGDPRGRGVVATSNYVARRFGIHSAMSAAEALRRCPQAVFVRPRHALYREYSRSVWQTVRGVVPTVEQTGVDEGYLDIGAASAGGKAAGARPNDQAAFGGRRGEVADDFLAARVVAEAVQTAVRAATSLTCSLGVAPCKVVAKVASDARKPGGLVVVPSGREAAFLAPLAVRRLPGVGPKAEERLRAAGIETIGDLAALTDEDLRRLLPGSVGSMLHDRARGIDPRELELDTERISISVENTFERDISDRDRLHEELRGMAAEVATALQRHGQVARTVTTKLRYADFSIRSRSMSLEAGIDAAETIGDLACQQLDRGLNDRPGALRLVGVGVSGLADFRQLSLDAV